MTDRCANCTALEARYREQEEHIRELTAERDAWAASARMGDQMLGQAKARIAELKELLHNREGSLAEETKISVGYLDKLAKLEAQAAEMRQALELAKGPVPFRRKVEMIDKALSSDAGKTTLERIQQLEEVLWYVLDFPANLRYTPECRGTWARAQKTLEVKA